MGVWRLERARLLLLLLLQKLKHGGFGGITTKAVEGKERANAAYHHSSSRVSASVHLCCHTTPSVIVGCFPAGMWTGLS